MAMHFADGFHREDGALYCGAVSVADVVDASGTPVFIYNLDAITDRHRDYSAAFHALRHTTCYAVKANSCGAVLRTLVAAGAGFDVNSRGELFRALRAGADPATITMTGVAKSAVDIDDALAAGIWYFNAESLEECARIDEMARARQMQARVVLRINPNVDAHTHPYIATGLAEHKFGLTESAAVDAVRAFNGFTHLALEGFGMHLGSQIFDARVFVEGLRKMTDFIDRIGAMLSAPVRVINMGGGIGVPYGADEAHITPGEVADALAETWECARKSAWADSALRLVSEPGRYFVANAGVLVARAEYIKPSGDRTFLLLDAGMNDLIRPALYEAYHHIEPVCQHRARGSATYDVAGPVCESGDSFAHGRTMRAVEAGDLVAIFSAGAYGSAMSSTYNTRPLAAEVAVRDGRFFIARARQTLEQLVENESPMDEDKVA